MQDVIDEALQRLYWACREGRNFPGIIPDESEGTVSTDAILRGLGLHPPVMDMTRPLDASVNSILHRQAQLSLPRSHRPPDLDPQSSLLGGRNVNSGASMPISLSGRRQDAHYSNVNGTAVIEHDDEEEESEIEVDPNEDDDENMAPESHEDFNTYPTIGADFDPSSMPGGFTIVPEAVDYFSGGSASIRPGQQAMDAVDYQQRQAPAQSDLNMVLDEQQVWEQPVQRPDDMLSWPADTTAVSGRTLVAWGKGYGRHPGGQQSQ
jgi:hypothetical protein